MAATSIYAFFHLFAIEINKRPVHNQVYGVGILELKVDSTVGTSSDGWFFNKG